MVCGGVRGVACVLTPLTSSMSGLIPKHTVTQQALACLAYGGVSISITLFNKAVFSIYNFKYPNLVMLGQMVVTLTLIKTASRYEIVEVSRISRSGLKKVGSSLSLSHTLSHTLSTFEAKLEN